MVVVIVGLVITHNLWLPLPGRFLIVADPPGSADAVVPLAGETQRFEYAAELFVRGEAGWFVATDMYAANWPWSFSYADWVKGIAVDAGVPADRILTPSGRPSTTYEEALAVRQLAIDRGWHTLRIVTSPSHTRRARYILADVFRDTGIAIQIQPVENHPYSPDSWWATARGRHETGFEYVKFALYLVGYR